MCYYNCSTTQSICVSELFKMQFQFLSRYQYVLNIAEAFYIF